MDTAKDITKEDFEILRNLGTNRWQSRADQRRDEGVLYRLSQRPKVCPVCEDSACEVKSAECGKG